MKKVKVFLPAIAILFAVAGALASNASKDNAATLIDVTAINASPCTIVGTCDIDQQEVCKTPGGATLYERASETSCANILSEGKFMPNP